MIAPHTAPETTNAKSRNLNRVVTRCRSPSASQQATRQMKTSPSSLTSFFSHLIVTLVCIYLKYNLNSQRLPMRRRTFRMKVESWTKGFFHSNRFKKILIV
jgi:hypothetical protein